jgi:hypothetical protein
VGYGSQPVSAVQPGDAIVDVIYRVGLTIVTWHALGLLQDIEARKSNVLVLGLHRTSSDTPKTFYTLKEACVAPLAEVKRKLKYRSLNPSHILRDHETKRLADGDIGAMLVMSVEQAEDDNRPVLEVLGKVSL